MLTPYLPFPLVSGGQIRTYNLLKKLSKNHKITLVSYYRKEEEKKHLAELKKFCEEVVLIKRRKTWGLKNIFLAGITPYPFLVCTYLSKTARNKIEQLINKKDFDLIHVETFYLMPVVPQDKVPILLVEQTIEHQVYAKFVKNFKFLPLKPFLLFDVWKIKKWEKFYWYKATRLAAVSNDDLEIMAESVDKNKLEVVANGIDEEYFDQVKRKIDKPTVFFVGNFKWLPNKEAALNLIEDIWPRIKKKVKNARLLIVGRNVTAKINQYNHKEGIEIKEDIKDIRDAFKKASVLVAPIRNGRGTKYKVLESMACGVPVVTTELGVEGIDAKDGENIFVADSEDELANKTASLLKDKKLNNKIGIAGKKLVRGKYNWKQITKHLDQVYQEMKKKNEA